MWEALLAGVRHVATQSYAIFLRVDPRVVDSETDIRSVLVEHGFRLLSEDWTTWNSPRVIMTLNIETSEEEIRRQFRRRHREYITAAAKHGVTVRPASSLEETIAFHASLAAHGRRKKLPVRNRTYFERLWEEYLRPGQGVLLLAEYQGEVVGGILGAQFGHQAMMFHVVLRDNSYRGRLQQGPILYWEFIRWAKAAGCTSIDWGGSGTHFPPREEDPGYGVYHFKLGFNSNLKYLTGYYDLVFLPRFYRKFRMIERCGADLAWPARARLNEGFPRMRAVVKTIKKKLRQFKISVEQQGFRTTLYWAAFGFLRVNRFIIFARDLSTSDREISWTSPPEVTVEMWAADTVCAWRKGRDGLSPEFFQDEIDGVDTCAVAMVNGQVAGIAWIYRFNNHSRLFQLREREAEVNSVFVLPEYRGRGLHKAMGFFICNYLWIKGYKMVYSAVHEGNEPSLRATRGYDLCEIGEIVHFLLYRPKFRHPATLTVGSKASELR
jgi:GNAT superfamily N-acetyltransferase